MQITFLGTGTSHGVPTIDCMRDNRVRCKKNVCELSETDPKHRRTRASIYIEHEGRGLLVDVSADFRQQILREKISRIDAAIITHAHADHVGGIPDIRSFTRPHEPALPIFGSQESVDNIRRSYNYIFDPTTFVGGGIPLISLNAIEPFKQISLIGLDIVPISVEHGKLNGWFGYRIGSIGYIPDMKSMTGEAKNLLKNLDVLKYRLNVVYRIFCRCSSVILITFGSVISL